MGCWGIIDFTSNFLFTIVDTELKTIFNVAHFIVR